MSTDVLFWLVAIALSALILWVGWPRRGHVLCERCHSRPVEQVIEGEWICMNCIDRQLNARVPRDGGRL